MIRAIKFLTYKNVNYTTKPIINITQNIRITEYTLILLALRK